MEQKKRKLSTTKKFAEIEVLDLFGSKIRLSPTGLWVYARSYAKAAQALPQPEVPYEPVRYFLACHSIELSLKAFLSTRGRSLLQLSEFKYGHNLEAILVSAETNNIDLTVTLSSVQKAEIKKATFYYLGKVFEYPASGEAIVAYPELPNLDVLIDTALHLVAKLEVPCREA